MATTEKPIGLTITRNGQHYICEWKTGDDEYDSGQWFQWRTNLDVATTTSGKEAQIWNPVNEADARINGTITEWKVKLASANYYPSASKDAVTDFTFRVRGQRSGYTYSDYTKKTLSILPPRKPTLEATWKGTNNANQTEFSWNVEVADDDNRPFTDVIWQSMLIKDCEEMDGRNLKWKQTQTNQWFTGTSKYASGSLPLAQTPEGTTEDTSVVFAPYASYTRWVRIRSRGIGGNSGWQYAKHVYAKPYMAKDLKADDPVKISGTKMYPVMNWIVGQPASHPIDSVDVQYLIATPAANQNPGSGATWTTAFSITDSSSVQYGNSYASGRDAATLVIDNTPGLDQCTWVRVVTKHDQYEQPSDPLIFHINKDCTLTGRLTNPSDLALTVNTSLHRITVSATNNSSVPDSKIAVYANLPGTDNDYICGIILPDGYARVSDSEQPSPITVQLPEWPETKSPTIKIQTFQGPHTSARSSDGVTKYTITPNMKSEWVAYGGTIPRAPKNVVASVSAIGEAMLTWDWDWNEANRAEISWSKNEYAWESVEAPSTYTLTNLYNAKIRIPNLETGTTWYFRVRIGIEEGDEIVYGPYSDTLSLDMSSEPMKPALTLSSNIITESQKLTVTWTYDSPDGTEQHSGWIRTATIDGDIVTPDASNVATVSGTSTSVTIPAGKWSNGSTVYLIGQVKSKSGMVSEWSDPVTLNVADPPECVIASTSLISVTDEGEDQDEADRTYYVLDEMPLTVTITGAGDSGTTTLSIERTEAYQMNRPDETIFNGFEGETIATFSQTGEDPIIITTDMLVGALDDGAKYRLVATVIDSLGQIATAVQNFEVRWTHQAVIPQATIVINKVDLTAEITPIAPVEMEEGDTCDIYRLSADKPEIIMVGAEFGTTYIDPYPASGPLGGHRIVYKTVNGDYITADNRPAWYDFREAEGDRIDLIDVIIDFGGDRVSFRYNMDLSNKWSKDFAETKYLGGGIQGDWNSAVSRSGSVSGTVIIADLETIRGMRRLARYSGVCHVRTPEGSSFAANVEVDESRNLYNNSGLATFNLNFTFVDSERYDGDELELTYPMIGMAQVGRSIAN